MRQALTTGRVGLAAALLIASSACLAAAPLYFTSFEEMGPGKNITFVGSPEWQKPARHPWAQNSNDPMSIRFYGDNDPVLFPPIMGRTGERTAYQHETFSQWSARRDFGQDLYDNFYVKVWINFQAERERIVNVQTPCDSGPYTQGVISVGTVTAADDGGQQVRDQGGNLIHLDESGGLPAFDYPACVLTKPSISDADSYFHDTRNQGTSELPTGVFIRMTSGAAAGKEWNIVYPTRYATGSNCTTGPYYYVPHRYPNRDNGPNIFWDFNHRVQVAPRAPNIQNPFAAGVRPGDTYEVRGAIAPLYRAVQLWVENKDQTEFAKFGIWHRYGGDAQNAVGAQCTDTNNWKYLTRTTASGANPYYYNPWVDTGIHRGFEFTGWHSLEVRVYGNNADQDKHQKFHFLVDDVVVGTAPRYTAEGPIPLNRMHIGGLAVSQEWAFWDDVEIGFLPEGPVVTELPSVGAAKLQPDDTWAALPPGVIDSVGDGWFHVQGDGPGSGIRCLYTMPDFSGPDPEPAPNYLKPGDVVIPVGKIATIDLCGQEKVLYAMNPHMLDRGFPIPPAVWADHRAIRRDAPTLKGMRVATWGTVVNLGAAPGTFYIDDKSDPNNTAGLKIVATGETAEQVNFFNFVTVKGVIVCEDGQPVFYVSNPEDVVIESFF